MVPGNEFAGTIEQVGEDVTGLTVGEPVLGFSTLGAYAEPIVVPVDQVVRKPATMPWEVAGGFSGHAQGARNALNQMKVTKGDTVLINAAAGGLGAFAVQLARPRGVSTVIGTASPANHEYLRARPTSSAENSPSPPGPATVWRTWRTPTAILRPVTAEARS
ncbi:hypothetical protein Aple_040250 [Acrocarpospora pleiomorpha]|uniref:Alcohol dehydrogenase-like N-terminal domain-containing protein n=1 Tax=Acrocarpospora pleiomorpha TaxID=90975 RepID=A0A5M3XLY5_9ACTN|nr:hypothetical protein [Acrocarpospora pleiomorpha]GES21129.1 hypothetical protein Aple_040250 [Acrocarpospora pleiomorpha]